MLKTEENDHDKWSDHVTELVVVYNFTPQVTTGLSLYFLIHGRESILPVDFMLGRTEEEAAEDSDS